MLRAGADNARPGADILRTGAFLNDHVEKGRGSSKAQEAGGPPFGCDFPTHGGTFQAVAEFGGKQNVSWRGRSLDKRRAGYILTEEVIVLVVEARQIEVD